jgi:flagellar FliL protein
MSDTSELDNDTDQEESGGKKPKKEKRKRSAGGVMASGMIKILVMVAAIIAAILFMVAISWITAKAVTRDLTGSILIDLEAQQYNPPGNYNYVDPSIQVRGRTSDRVPRSFMITTVFGVLPGDDRTTAELARRNSQLRDLLRQFFSSRKVEELSPEREAELKIELRGQVNRILSQGRVSDILFTEFIVEF